MTHTIVSEQTPRAMFRQLKFKLSQVFPISRQHFSATNPVGIMRSEYSISDTALLKGVTLHHLLSEKRTN